jgi:hypothetical protein
VSTSAKRAVWVCISMLALSIAVCAQNASPVPVTTVVQAARTCRHLTHSRRKLTDL